MATKTIKYIGTAPLPEEPITGSKRVWDYGQTQSVDSVVATQLLTTGLFEDDAGTPVSAKTNPLTGEIGIPMAGGRQIRANQMLRPTHTTCFASSLDNVDNSVNLSNYVQMIMLPVRFSAIRIGYPHLGGKGALAGMRALVAATDEIGDLTYTNTSACKKFITPMRTGWKKTALRKMGGRLSHGAALLPRPHLILGQITLILRGLT